MTVRFEIRCIVNTENEAQAIVAALTLLAVKATVHEFGPLGEMLDADDAAKEAAAEATRS